MIYYDIVTKSRLRIVSCLKMHKWEVLVIKTKHHYILQTVSEKAGYM